MNNSRATVFVIDDEESVRKALGRLLRASGYDAAVFGSAQEFLDHCDPDIAGCLVLDVAMPEMSGPDLQEILAEREITWPIIFLTGQDDAPVSFQARNQGTIGFFTKPVDGANLLAAVATAIEQDCSSRAQRRAWVAGTMGISSAS